MAVKHLKTHIHKVSLERKRYRVARKFSDRFPCSPVRTNDVAVILHLFYCDLWKDIQSYLDNIPGEFDLYVSVTNKFDPVILRNLLDRYPKAVVKIYDNRGRDILPFLYFLSDICDLGYTAVCKIHSKKSPHLDDGGGWKPESGETWRSQIYDELLGTECKVKLILDAFEKDRQLGMIGPAGSLLNYLDVVGGNRDNVQDLMKRLNIIDENFTFFAGSMFWFRPVALKKIVDLHIQPEDFPPEKGQDDGTFAHALERILAVVVIQNDWVVMSSGGSDDRLHKVESVDITMPDIDWNNNARVIIEKFINKLTFSRYILAVSHTNYRDALGGTEKLINAHELMFREQQVSYIHFFPIQMLNTDLEMETGSTVVGVTVDQNYIGIFSVKQLGLVLQILQRENIAEPIAFHVQHMINSPPGILDQLLDMVKVSETVCFIHDFYLICPQINLLFNGDSFCGDSIPPCTECTCGERRGEHVTAMHNLLYERATHFVIPSECAKNIWARYYPELADRIQVVPHQLLVRTKAIRDQHTNPRIRLAYVGAAAKIKGWQTWCKLVSRIDNSKFELFHIGATDEQYENVQHVPVSFIESGQDATVGKLRELNIDVVFLWSICPETYSFTTFESIAADCLIITNPCSGNVACQVRERSCGVVLETEQTLWDFLHDDCKIKNMLNEYKGKASTDLHFNPQFIMETIQKHSTSGGNAFFHSYKWESVSTSTDTIVMDNMRKLEYECVTARRVLKKIDEAETIAAIQQQELVHRFFRTLKTRLNQHPHCKRALKELLGPLLQRIKK